jgi:hypothetical protein
MEYLGMKKQNNNNYEKKPRKILIKINFIYSLAYQIPLLLFMPYHILEE